MDSQEMTTAEAIATPQETTDAATQENRIYKTKEEVLARAEELISSSIAETNKQEIEHLRTAFYRLLSIERTVAEKKIYRRGGRPYAILCHTLTRRGRV